jgi:hypothetical protein
VCAPGACHEELVIADQTLDKWFLNGTSGSFDNPCGAILLCVAAAGACASGLH